MDRKEINEIFNWFGTFDNNSSLVLCATLPILLPFSPEILAIFFSVFYSYFIARCRRLSKFVKCLDIGVGNLNLGNLNIKFRLCVSWCYSYFLILKILFGEIGGTHSANIMFSYVSFFCYYVVFCSLQPHFAWIIFNLNLFSMMFSFFLNVTWKIWNCKRGKLMNFLFACAYI